MLSLTFSLTLSLTFSLTLSLAQSVSIHLGAIYIHPNCVRPFDEFWFTQSRVLHLANIALYTATPVLD